MLKGVHLQVGVTDKTNNRSSSLGRVLSSRFGSLRDGSSDLLQRGRSLDVRTLGSWDGHLDVVLDDRCSE